MTKVLRFATLLVSLLLTGLMGWGQAISMTATSSNTRPLLAYPQRAPPLLGLIIQRLPIGMQL
ncbi:MAG: hypothetical protein IPP77_15905 [Bacteroidetes bacterium]|nr:hypothetical protein [Bacteroidota bacterium]